jgi:hypothetical protein
MIRRLRLPALVGLSVLLALAGCASGPSVALLTYETAPAGATLYEAGQSIGVAPVTRRYPGDPQTGMVRTPDVVAVWPSGAKTSFWTNLHVGDDRITTLQRPANAPNLALDQDNAAKLTDQAKRDAARAQSSLMTDQARGSARCKAQQQSGHVGNDDCQ